MWCVGMAAITATIMQLCNSGDHIVASSTVYGVFRALCHFPAVIATCCQYQYCCQGKRRCEDQSVPPAGGTFALLKSFLPLKCGIQTTFVDISDLPAVEAAITSRTKVSYLFVHSCCVGFG